VHYHHHYFCYYVNVCCHRFHREQTEGEVVYDIIPESVSIDSSALRLRLSRRGHSDILSAEIFLLADNILRMKLKPAETDRQRYEIPVGDVLVSEPVAQR